MLSDLYLGKTVMVIGDPSGTAKSTMYEETSFDLVKRAGFAAFPAPTNDIDPRLRAVEAWLLAQRDGGPAMMIDKDRCPVLIRALGGGYLYAKTKSGQRKPVPEKNEYSHVADACQYAALATHGGLSSFLAQRLQGRRRVEGTRVRPAAWT